jgi:hypothetical protein
MNAAKTTKTTRKLAVRSGTKAGGFWTNHNRELKRV